MYEYKCLLFKYFWSLTYCILPQINGKQLKTGWTNIFSQKNYVFSPFCVIKFIYHRINKSTTGNCSYLVGEAICKFKNCLRYEFRINDIPNPATENGFVKVNVLGSISCQHFDNLTSNSRKLSGQERKLVAGELVHNSASSIHYKQFEQSSSLDAAKHGNLNFLKSQEVFRKVKSEHDSNSRLSDDMWQDIIITQRTYDSNIKGAILNGYIQTISRYPIVIHMHTEEQIRIIKKLQPGNLIMHLDATGSIVRKMDKFHTKKESCIML